MDGGGVAEAGTLSLVVLWEKRPSVAKARPLQRFFSPTKSRALPEPPSAFFPRSCFIRVYVGDITSFFKFP